MRKQRTRHSIRLNRYFRQIRYMLPCNKATKDHLIRDLRDRADSIVEENPQISFNEIVRKLGTADQIVEEYMVSLDDDELRRKVISSQRVIRFLIIFAIVVIVALVATIVGIIVWNQSTQGSGAIISTTITTK